MLFAALDCGFGSSVSCSSATTEPSRPQLYAAPWKLIVAQLVKDSPPCVDSEGL
jgi:hypothetical protein